MIVTVAVAVSMCMAMEEKQSDNVGQKTQRADDYDCAWPGHLGLSKKTLECFHKDAEAEGQKKHTVKQSSQNFGTLPSIRVLRTLSALFYKAHCVQGYHKRHDIVQHVETVCHQCEGADSITADNLDEEENNIDPQEDDNFGLIIQPHFVCLVANNKLKRSGSAAIPVHHSRSNFFFDTHFLQKKGSDATDSESHHKNAQPLQSLCGSALYIAWHFV